MEKLLRKIAWSFSMSTGLELDDLYQEANLAYLEALRTHNPAKGSISTHVWHCVHNHLKDYIDVELKHHVERIDDIEITYSNNSFWDNFTKDVTEIVSIVLDKPLEFDMPDWDVQRCRQVDYQKQIKSKLSDILTGKGWSKNRICENFSFLHSLYSK
jgi:DNA-directed RNA polymerase specialized sigma24 family protein